MNAKTFLVAQDELQAAHEILSTLALLIIDKDDTKSKGTAAILFDQAERIQRVQSMIEEGE